MTLCGSSSRQQQQTNQKGKNIQMLIMLFYRYLSKNLFDFKKVGKKGWIHIHIFYDL